MMIKAAVRGPTSCGCNCSVEIIIPAVNYFAGVSCNMRQEVVTLKAPSQRYYLHLINHVLFAS